MESTHPLKATSRLKQLRSLLYNKKMDSGALATLYTEYAERARSSGNHVWIIGAFFIPLSLSGLVLAYESRGSWGGLVASFLAGLLIAIWGVLSEVLHCRLIRDLTLSAEIASVLLAKPGPPLKRGLEDFLPTTLPLAWVRRLVTLLVASLCLICFCFQGLCLLWRCLTRACS